jgi:glycosyltransferase involved in cell wall biosynthesis
LAIKSLHVGTFKVGGAATAMLRLQNALKGKIDGQAIYFCDLPKNKVIQSQNKINIIINKLQGYFKKKADNYADWEIEVFLNQLKSARSNGLEYASLPVSNVDLTQSNIYKQSDIVHLHWVANGLDWPTFFKKNKKPVVWTIHDMNPFSGIEHFEEPYFGIDEAGYPLARKKSEAEFALGNKWALCKKTALEGVNNIHIVSPSQWLFASSQKSELFNRFPHYHIPYSVPEDKFKVLNKNSARKELGLPPGNKKIFLFVADSIENERKGYAYLQRAISQINQYYDILLVAIGQNNNNNMDENIVYLGKISDEQKMASAYAAADAFIIPSLEDNLPNTMLESLMCGTPVIGFPVGGIQETILDGFNGYLCERIGVPPLVENLKKFLDNADSFSREAIAADALNKYASDIQANAYLNLYEDILNSKK